MTGRKGKLIYLLLCLRLKFDHTDKYYMHKIKPVLENESHKILGDFKIQTDLPSSDRI